MLAENKSALDELSPKWKLTANQIEQLAAYVELIEAWSQRTNLLSKSDIRRIVARHIAESVDFGKALQIPQAAAVMDLGAGAGFPGIPMKILQPALKLTLVDSKRMKSLFLQEVIEQLRLTGTDVLGERVEDLVAAGYSQRFDIIVSRAVASLTKVWQWSVPLLKSHGFLAIQKGGDFSVEMKELKESFSYISLRTILIHPTLDNQGQTKSIVLVAKNAAA